MEKKNNMPCCASKYLTKCINCQPMTEAEKEEKELEELEELWLSPAENVVLTDADRENMMSNYYFTFESWAKFPYKNTYLVIEASSYDDAVKKFREKYPDINPDCMDCYSKELYTPTCFGKKPEGYEDLFIFVPEMKQILRISEGTGDNLLPEDIELGYVDYIYYEQYVLNSNMTEVGGRKILLNEMLRERYHCMADCIHDVLSNAYGSHMYDCMILA